MTKIAQNTVAKLSVALVTAAMALSMIAPAQAQTVEELQAQIAALMAQINGLQTSTGTGSCVSIPAPLTIGSQGADVTALQNALIAAGQSIPAGATGYFGSQTQAALAAWQAANGVSPAAGYYGPITKAAMDAKCVPTTDDGDDDDDSTDDGDDSTDLSGEASLDSMTLDSASDDELEEGAEDAEIATVTFEFTDGDAEISRLDVSVSSTSADAWDVLDTLSLWVDGDMVAEVDASDEDEYLDETAGTLRFSGLDIVAMEDEEVEIMIAATIQGGIDTEDLGAYNVSVDTLRFFDADGVATTEDGTVGPDDFGDTVSFTIDEAGSEDELIAKTSSNDPDATTLQVEDDQKSDWYTVFVFDLDTDDSINDIELNTVVVNASTTLGSYDTFVDDAELVIDGTTIDDVTVTNGASAAIPAVLTFDVDGDVVIDAGDRVEAELKLRFKSLASVDEGATVKGSISSLTTAIVDAEGAEDLDNSQLSGAATGEAHTLRTMGVITEMTDDSATVTTGDNAGDDYATFEITVDVTAFEQDVYISTNVATSVSYSIVDGAGATVAGTDTPVLTSTADETNGFFVINEGETESVTLQVTFDATSANSAARLLLNSISFDEAEDTTPDQTQTTLPATDYRTSVVTLVN